MAQTGFTPIQIYSSSTAAAAPVAGSLTNSTLGSELAINITDGKLFYKDNANVIQVIGWKVVPAVAGGTGQTSYAVGDILFANTTTSLAKLADVATGNALISGGVGAAPAYGKIGLTTHISGVLPVANGGTNASTASITSFNNITGYTASGATGTTSTNLVFSTSPSITTPTLVGDVTVSTGNVVIGTSGKGIDFSATPGTGTSELLADYEEGTWTVTLHDASSGGNASATTVTGYYTKVGNLVTASFTGLNNIDTTGMTGANVLYFSLPFTASSTGAACGSFMPNTWTFRAGAGSLIAPLIVNSATRGRFASVVNAGAPTLQRVTELTSGTSDIDTLTITYMAA
jgi:hypothetical protein